MSSSSSLEVGTAVWVHKSDSPEPLEGAVAYIGPVDFSPDEWIGVRLTGPHVSRGNHDGTVQNKSYFACPPSAGLFCKPSNVKVRELTKLEQVRLKRELLSKVTKTTATSPARTSRLATPTRTTTSSARVTRSSTTATASSATSSSPAPTAAAAKKEALAARRAKLVARKQETKPQAEAAVTTTTEPTKVEAAVADQQRLKELQQALDKSQEEALMLQTELFQSQQQAKTVKTRMEELQEQLEQQASQQQTTTDDDDEELQETRQALRELQANFDNLEQDWKQSQQANTQLSKESEATKSELLQAQDTVNALQGQVAALESQQQGQQSTQEHVRERARLQALVAAHERHAQEHAQAQQEWEHTVEELTLDKEQLQEQVEGLTDQVEELKLDLDTAQMEAEEAKLHLEDAQSQVVNVGGGGGDDEALGLQNARMRQALIRLREQSGLDQLESQRTIRALETQMEQAKGKLEQLESLEIQAAQHKEAVEELKLRIEEYAALESMVEDLSDQNWNLEEQVTNALQTIREMEEGADLTAEMEEVQADEIKALYLDLQGRDTIISNLEQAIQIQRRRQEDLERMVGNYKSRLTNLQQEKQALLELQQGSLGKQSEMEQSSQQALARAAQLVARAAQVRRDEAAAAATALKCTFQEHLAGRLQDLLPHVGTSEVTSIKGELLTCKVVDTAGETLRGLEASFVEAMQPGANNDEAQQQARIMLHQAQFAQVLASGASDWIRFVAAGQWPELVTPPESATLGALLGSLTPVDKALGNVLQTLKLESTLEQSDVGAVEQCIQIALESMETATEQGSIFPKDWAPPAWALFKDATLAKYACLGAAAATGAVAPPECFTKLEQLASQAQEACLRMVHLDVLNETAVGQVESHVRKWREDSGVLLNQIQEIVSKDKGDWADCQTKCEASMASLTKLASILRSVSLNPTDDERYHAFSPESRDSWQGITNLCQTVRTVDGDADDVNHAIRARSMEESLDQAVANEPKLALANTKVATMEKSISTRSKEIAMLNARLSELEALLAKTNASPIKRSQTTKSVEELSSLKEENRVLNEAMEVLQNQVHEYEEEIRVLKDFKSPKRGGTNRTPRRAMTSISDLSSPTPSRAGPMDEATSHALETAIFRPALENAMQEASRWKAAVVQNTLASLEPLPSIQTPQVGEDWRELDRAVSALRLEAACLKVVDLTKPNPRQQLRDLQLSTRSASQRVEAAMLRCRSYV